MDEHYEIFRRNFPFIIRDEKVALTIINDPENEFIDIRDEKNDLIATSIIHKNTILMLCVDNHHRQQGIGTRLLNASENYIAKRGYDVVKVGVESGGRYLMPGIPMATKPHDELLKEENIYADVNDDSYEFFSKRGYIHSWKDSNCFDMQSDLSSVVFPEQSIGDTIDGITYRLATVDDISQIIKCTDDAQKSFSKYYEDKKLYDKKNNQRVLIATKNDEICGTLIIGIETEGKGLGSVGCTTVAHRYRGRHIGVNMVVLGTKYLQSLGLKKAYLGYTYSGLDEMYGYAGYKICIYYDMAQKELVKK